MDEQLDGLEIICIGSLYSGSWDKKYWSSSRGKDRYPYPVGYEARRSYNGGVYTMQIRQGPKGPLFEITSVDGHLCSSGQTPDIAWKKFQRGGLQNVKIWPGKRSSCKIDGVEFFGLKNPLVQRLLREMMANVNGSAEQSLASSSFLNEACRTYPIDKYPDERALPDLLSCFSTPRITGKRNKRCKIIDPNSSNAGEINSTEQKDVTCIAKASSATVIKHIQQNSLAYSISSFNEENEHDRLPQKMPESGNLQSLGGEEPSNLSVQGDTQNFLNNSVHLMENSVHGHEESKPDASNDLLIDEKYLPRSQHIEVKKPNCPISVNEKAENAFTAEDSQGNHRMSLFVPDTEDFGHGTQDRNSCGLSDVYILGDMGLSEGLVTESHPEEDIATSNSNINSGKSDFDSVGEEVAKSMMTVLLPQAVPLLKRSSSKKKKKKKSVSPLQNLPSSPKPDEVSQEAEGLAEVQTVQVDHSVISGSEELKCIGFHSFDDNQCGLHAAEQHIIPPCNLKTDLSNIVRVPHPACNDEHFADHIIPSGNKAFSEEHQNVSEYLHGNLTDARIESQEKSFLMEPNSVGDASNSFPMSATISTEARGSGMSVQLPEDIIPNHGTASVHDASTTGTARRVYSRKKVRHANSTTTLHNVLLSESICRSSTTETLPDSELLQMHHSTDKPHTSSDRELHCQPKERLVGGTAILEFGNRVSSQKQGTGWCNNITSNGNDVDAQSHQKPERNLELKNELSDIIELLGCYFHHRPLSSVMLRTKGSVLYIAALCGPTDAKKKTLYLYQIAIEELRIGFPCSSGHTLVFLPSLTDLSGREIAAEGSGLQLTPDGQCLVLIGSIKTPYCSEGRVDCLCSRCKSDCSENCEVKVVQVKAGYVSLLLKVRTTESLHCILVSEPNHLIAAGESGTLHVWTMNSTWSEQTKECTIQVNYSVSPCIFELKRISASLVIGRNGFGEFTIWDISRRVLVSKFCAPSASVLEFFPIGLFSWQRELGGLNYTSVEEHIDKIMDANWFLEQQQNHSFQLLDGEDIAIWLIVSTASDSDAQDDTSIENHKSPVGKWRLALLSKNKFFMGSSLDSRATAICSSAGHGIMGTIDGVLCVWNLITGVTLGILHHFSGSRINCIGTDRSNSSFFTVATDKGELLVYRRSQKKAENQDG
ncbi:hypothetical protein K2173_016960 [Erythroxylum novogranatense]|uniref:FYR C-terminal domain-containing protein n=1 Tax=Erythroxylum novogranatense TaxID=1862640 RepID=A0AAV8U8K5_9ROSI|nr:hypothetical protein K2173_016960 [Erythroxylum novogranatense]